MGNQKIDSFFKRKGLSGNNIDSSPIKNLVDQKELDLDSGFPSISKSSPTPSPKLINSSIVDNRPSKAPRVEQETFDASTIERDPGLRNSIWDFPPNQRDEVRRAYIGKGPYQPIPSNDPKYVDKYGRRFLSSWYKLFPDWLEYSPTKDAAYCLPCFLFSKPLGRFGSNTFTRDGFRSWKKVNEGSNCAFLLHVGKNTNSLHKNAMISYHDLKNSLQHIQKVIEKQSSEQVAKNRLQLKVSIEVVKWLTFQGCALRGRDETEDSTNRGNFLELVSFLASYNDEVATVLKNAPKNSKYVSPKIQKEILCLFRSRIQKHIREEIGEQKFCVIVDEARDESKREQMAIVLRYVDKEGFIRERFFDLVHVKETTSSALKKEICDVLSHHCLNVKDIRGQGYDGASNMRGEFNGLQALLLKECPFAYYIHCLAHRLQLTLVAASKEVIPVAQFFSYLTIIINLIMSSCKRQDQLRDAQASYIADMIAIEELETGKRKNQIGTLQRAGDTRWGSHLTSLCSLLKMFDATCSVLENIISDGNLTQRSEADSVYDVMTSFEFVFILHLMIDLLSITNDLSQALQRKSQDILNALCLVSSAKKLIQRFREEGWDSLLEKVTMFCDKHNIEIPDMNAPYKGGRGRPRLQRDAISVKHHYRVDIFVSAIDSQMHEMNIRFKDDMMELLKLSFALDPRDGYKSFCIADICKLANKFYPEDFTEQERLHLKVQLEHFELEARGSLELRKASTISELCQVLANTRKSSIYHLLDRLVRLVLTLPVSTATTERAFSAMKLVKTHLRNKMEDEFLSSYLITYIEKEIARCLSVDSLIDDFDLMKERRAQFRMPTFDM
ncbi:hypothetical protein like AT1G19260 [Hibiscus trionum]|uniref:TTF-type domain-containing protein n=1 Tax=Hibiscus trionum TaxID=183268 RepID=A0A9W7LYZ8_HIBTR|nr:hypothetical protein like AT1G19260 [Hibiscus trionum]